MPGSALGSPTAALTVPLPGSRSRYVFALPQADGLVYLGLTDEPVEGPVPDDDPVPSDAEVQQLLETVNQVLAVPVTRDDLVGAYSGLRPLVLPVSAGAGPGGATADLSRTHLLHWDGPVLSVVGGKLTTYRAMAEETVDAVVGRLGRGWRARSPGGCRWWGPRPGRPSSGWRRPAGWWPGTAPRRPWSRRWAPRRSWRDGRRPRGAALRRPPRGRADRGRPARPPHPDRAGPG
ncbi:hypothetical protein [Blastococcus brunescens]|uniref:FAD dependent oxidoreductase domain-containing protein n=1 Tax=Blastococcus brunescens TaxID=1564165 RepID=A0ABZ1B407_9ACTN|nr:hypothetical protein [Blastococcus sp. BMG 8361]WRL64084.1 hypothetical protein U6N30_31645 [Blastococcus sp. BMG 8361]